MTSSAMSLPMDDPESQGGTSPDHVLNVAFSDTAVILYLADGCVLSVPLMWYPALLNASRAARSNWRLTRGGCAIHWPDIGQNLSVAGILGGDAIV